MRVFIYEGIPDAGPFLSEQWGKGWIHFHSDWGPTNLNVQAILDTSMGSPQHIIPGIIAPLLLLQLRHHPRFLAVAGILLAICLFWSTLLSIALLALSLGLLAGNRLRLLLTWQNLLVAPLLAGMLTIYLASSGAGLQIGWLWEVYDDRLRMAFDMLVLYTVEFGVLAFLLWRVRPQTARYPFFFISLAILLAVYWFYVGLPLFSELSIRMAVPAVTVLAFFASRAVVERLPEMSAVSPAISGGMNRDGRRPSRIALAVLVIVLIIGAANGFYALSRAFDNTGMFRYEHVQYSLTIDLPRFVVTQRTTEDVPGLLQILLRENDDKGGDKGKLVIDTDSWDVYFRDNRLIYVNESCPVGFSEQTIIFFLHIYPVDRSILPPERREYGFLNRDFRPGIGRFVDRDRCTAGRTLPEFEIELVRTGQYIKGEGRLWEGEFRLDD